ncbi:MAG TPA: PEP-CTERM sorting domain-containing protein [Rhizomicrobium sp.]|nr:PEP-CTERM sorting domain-containing protein [Rhizomicrobium sp.]
MLNLRTTLIAAGLALAALAATSPARANLIISCSGSGCSGNLATSTTNTVVTACAPACTFGDFTIGPLSMLGYQDAAGKLADTENLDVSASGTGSISIDFTETNLNAGTAAAFIMDFTGNLSGSLTATRQWYLDTSNTGGLGQLLGTCSSGTCSTMASALKALSGPFSLTEVVTLNASGSGFLSSDDDIYVPEPATLSIFGLGLLALGAFQYRRKTGSIL